MKIDEWTIILINSNILLECRTHLTIKAAKGARDSMMKLLYSQLFSQIVFKMNSSSVHLSSNKFIGIVDIAGMGNINES